MEERKVDTDLQADTDMLVTLTSDIVSAHLSNNIVAVDDVAKLITSVHQALAGLGSTDEQEIPPEPAVSIRASVKKDHLVCLEDGKKMKMLKRHLSIEHGMTPDQYRQRWGLSSEYPMVAPDYAETRRDLAIKIGLGRKPAIIGAQSATGKKATGKPTIQKSASKAGSKRPAATRKKANGESAAS
jgi:predicted transcriptional regulator